MSQMEQRIEQLEMAVAMLTASDAESWMVGPQVMTSQLLGGGGSPTWKYGRFAIDSKWKLKDRYVMFGDAIYEVSDEHEVEKGVTCVVISASAEDTEPVISIRTLESMSDVISESKREDMSVLPLYIVEEDEGEGSRRVKCDLRIGPGSTMWEFGKDEEQ